MAFIVGMFVLRQTHAIWSMTSSNAVTMNSTMNFAFGMNPITEIITMILIIMVVGLILSYATKMGF